MPVVRDFASAADPLRAKLRMNSRRMSAFLRMALRLCNRRLITYTNARAIHTTRPRITASSGNASSPHAG